MLEALRASLIERIGESRQVLLLIKRLEPQSPLIRDSQEVVILRGIFYVSLYSILEFTIQGVVQEALRLISNKSVPFKCFSGNFYSVALDSEFKSSRDSNEKKLIVKRLELLEKQNSSESRSIDPSVLSMYFQNVDADTLKLIFKCFCIDDDFSSVSRYLLFVSEIKEKRNLISHGRESAYFVGQSTRANDLEIRFEAVQNISNYIVDKFEICLQELNFITPEFREHYV